ncbi:MAG: peptidase S41 [Marinilabiliales bacterium]|nr:MAG: peptidase S41 [Marinilabiliales bacterium]
MKQRTYIWLIISAFCILSFTDLPAQDKNNFEISKNIEIYVDVLRQLNLNYADNINPGELNKIAIDAMLNKLDPYTVYVPESQLEDFELMTKGEYGGIGALIQKQDGYVVITEPYEGFPAQKSGLKAGDKIISIDGELARDKDTPEVSEKLKGVPGTTVTLIIESYGDTTQKVIEILREKVKFPNIPYYGMIGDGIGYISLMQFNPNAASDVQKAFNELRTENNMKGVILDLRGNGGGLLNEAVDITNIFVQKGQTIVTTKGKLSENVQVHRTRNNAIDPKIPLVVLVNNNSASASEIVAGAIQDLDRGIIIGERTFGKGLVQHVTSLPYNSKMKITVAKYYIPSGRCIQSIDYFNKNANGDNDKVPDSLISSFKTKGGRTVLDGGGIIPDICIKPVSFSQITADLYANNYIFDYANKFAAENTEIDAPGEFEITDPVYDDFKLYVENQEFNYLTETESLIERMKKSAERESYLLAIEAQLDTVDSLVKEEKKKDIEKFRSEIEELLLMEIVSRYYYQKGKIIATVQHNEEIEEAKKVLLDEDLYKSVLDGTYKKSDCDEE